MSNRSLIGFGHIWHQRLRPVVHAFRYPGYFLLLPLRSLRDQPDALLRRNRRAAISFYDRDHGDGSADCLAWFDQLLQQEGIKDAVGEVWLHTFPRVLGYAFKPVSFWYAHRADGSLAAVLAEVNNTFGERHAYLLAGPDLAWGTEQVAAKCFHVSPFCTVQGEYRFRFVRSDNRNLVQVDLHDEAGPLLRTGVAGTLQPLTPASVRRAFWGIPLMTWGVVLRIHWQALRLWFKRLPFHRKPTEPKRFVTR
ncbi:DUF1365 domain-containing protein [Comamonas sp. JUb58]|uniref:DUF1365 domain-containing protein n=1 Tax=Comamonas sp. JUb58 TaxID=2485114 RepID=UPI00105F0146|nr:DUF1365 domain-containing protein [Comamonas sp. JUb58]TDS76637.1 hypothetical protein EDF71_11329 [Comamonas sp. JUb58]